MLGVSNVSFGLAQSARAVLNSVFLYHAVQAGLDLAIVNPEHIRPTPRSTAEERELAEDLIFDRREDALPRSSQHFDGKTASRRSSGRGPARRPERPTSGSTCKILHRKKRRRRGRIDRRIDERARPRQRQRRSTC